jgi:hypothetical protein
MDANNKFSTDCTGLTAACAAGSACETQFQSLKTVCASNTALAGHLTAIETECKRPICQAAFKKVDEGSCKDNWGQLCAANTECNSFFLDAQTKCATFHEGTILTQHQAHCSSNHGLSQFEKNCLRVNACCGSSPTSTFETTQCQDLFGSSGNDQAAQPQSCKNSELGHACTSCSSECKGAPALQLTESTFNMFEGDNLQKICEDTKCTPKYFKSAVIFTDTMMKPECSSADTSDNYIKTEDIYSFMCTQNADKGYCLKHMMSPETKRRMQTRSVDSTPAPKLSCSDEEIVKMKAAGCCVGTFVAMLANGNNQTISEDFKTQVLEVSDECGLNIVPCGTGAIADVVQVKSELELSGVTVDQVRANRQAFTKAVAAQVGVEEQNVIITGVNAGTTAQGRKLADSTKVNFAVTVTQNTDSTSATNLETKVIEAGTTDAAALNTAFSLNGLSTTGTTSAGTTSMNAVKAEGLADDSSTTTTTTTPTGTDGYGSPATVAGNGANAIKLASSSLILAAALFAMLM